MFHKLMFHANLKRIHRDSQETKPCRVENVYESVWAECLYLHYYFNQNSFSEV